MVFFNFVLINFFFIYYMHLLAIFDKFCFFLFDRKQIKYANRTVIICILKRYGTSSYKLEYTISSINPPLLSFVNTINITNPFNNTICHRNRRKLTLYNHKVGIIPSIHLYVIGQALVNYCYRLIYQVVH